MRTSDQITIGKTRPTLVEHNQLIWLAMDSCGEFESKKFAAIPYHPVKPDSIIFSSRLKRTDLEQFGLEVIKMDQDQRL